MERIYRALIFNDMSTNLQKNTEIQVYRGIRDTIGFRSTLFYAINMIRSGHYADTIAEIRRTKDKSDRDTLKSRLYAAAWAGIFSNRGKGFCTSPSGIACLDFDRLADPQETKRKLSRSRYCLAAFVSPSGNGVKMLVRIPLVIGDERYKEYYNAALLHYVAFDPDTSTKDISRLCFLSHDPDLYLNENAEVFTKRVIPPVQRPKVRNLKSIGRASEGAKIRGIFKWWEREHWNPSARNNSLYILAATFCEFGVYKESAWEIISTYEQPDLRLSELKKVVASAYKRVSFNSKQFA